MRIRKALPEDTEAICEMIEQAKVFLRGQGINQWQNGYPNRAVVEEDIRRGVAYVADDGEVCGFCAVLFGEDPNYREITQGSWLNQEPYAAIHRVCVSNRVRGRGTAGFLFRFGEQLCLEKNVHNLKVDTHPENMAMQRAIEKAGFSYCGIIHLLAPAEHGAPRRAYQKSF